MYKTIVPPPGNYNIISEFGDVDYPPLKKVRSCYDINKSQ